VALQLDWTHASELAVRVAGGYTNTAVSCSTAVFQLGMATRCQSESLLSLRQGLQAGLHQLARCPGFADGQQQRGDAPHWTGAERDFNPEFASLCAHYGLVPKTIGIGCPMRTGMWSRATDI